MAARTIGEIFHELIDDVEGIVRSEIRLARAEAKEDLAKARRAAMFFAAGVGLAVYALGFTLLIALRWLDTVVAPWLSPLICAVGVGIPAAILLATGRRNMRELSGPDKTIKTVKENLEWIKDQV
jgi:purine-cytosine permease-like protein